ncbi:hypothetical protein BD779DRAFT_1536982 [Infundibulicybe gibba]|nr:hypothetical protein BD779DRAFT_1536982 [Infundibulicybe gibba]
MTHPRDIRSTPVLCFESALCGIFLLLFTISMHLLLTARDGSTGGSPIPKLGWVTVVWFPVVMLMLVIFVRPALPSVGSLLTILLCAHINLIYRLWVTWEHRRTIIALPLILLIGFIVYAGGFIATSGGFGWGHSQWSIGLYLCMASNNVYCTGLMSWKIWNIEKSAQSTTAHHILVFRTIVIESAMLYSLWSILLALTGGGTALLAGSMLADTLAPIAGITFMLINIRLGLRRLSVPDQTAPATCV